MKERIKKFVEALRKNAVDVIITNDYKSIVSEMDGFVSHALSASLDTGIIFFGGFEEKRDSTLANHHIAIVEERVLCENTIDAYKLAISKSNIVFASSSASKTADVEGKLIWGVHGPEKFTVVIVTDEEMVDEK